MENNIIKFLCPHCQQPLAVRKSDNAQGVSLTCPNCNNTIRIKIQEKPIRLSDNIKSNGIKMAGIVISEGPQTVKSKYSLHVGNNIIGRSDDDTVQDIAIEGDMTISRRSVDLVVDGNASKGFSYSLKVLKAVNMVYVNNKPIHVGDSASLHPGDSILLGNTKLMLSL